MDTGVNPVLESYLIFEYMSKKRRDLQYLTSREAIDDYLKGETLPGEKEDKTPEAIRSKTKEAVEGWRLDPKFGRLRANKPKAPWHYLPASSTQKPN